VFETEMGHLWSEDCLISPRDRFKGRDLVGLSWEQGKRRKRIPGGLESGMNRIGLSLGEYMEWDEIEIW
jgi:hypothetical protein